MKKPFVTLEQLQEIVKQYPTPFHLYDEKGIRENARALKAAFAWNPGYKEFFAVKATPNPQNLKILKEEGCGVDCSSLCELMMSDRCGFQGGEIMFSSNDTPAEEFALAAQLGATINLDDITHIDFLKDTIGYIPKKISCRFNPGGTFQLGESKEGFQVMDNPGEAKYGMTREQIAQAFKRLKEMGAEEFGIHAFLASNTLSNDYYPALAKILFQLAVDLKNETGAHITFINLSGGVGIPYRPEQPANDIAVIGEGVRRAYEEVLVPAGMDDVSICTELGRFMLAPYGHLVTKVLHQKHIYKEYIGVDACASNLMRPTTTSPSWARRTPPATTSTTSPALCARTATSSPLTACCRRSASATCWSSTTPVPTATPWDISTTAACARRRCSCVRTAPPASSGGPRRRRIISPEDYFATAIWD